jgi:enoyl-CoA hydratase
MSFRHIAYEVADGRARITLDRPEKLNAISPLMEHELEAALWEADDDVTVHSIIVRGAGRSFCSGFDLTGDTTGMPARDASRYRGRATIDDDAWLVERSNARLLAAFDVHKPVIAQVQGHCVAGGTVIALFCDFVICADDAVFGFPAARDLGALPANVWLYHVGPQWAKRLTMTGDSISGVDAAHLGLALKSVPLDRLEDEVEGLADRFALIDHHLLSANKRIVNLGLELMGARTLQRLAAENDARAHLAPGTAEYRRRVRELGLRQALRERDGAFGDGRARVREPEGRLARPAADQTERP